MKKNRLTAEQWNERHPVGTLVRYWSVLPEREYPDISPLDTETRSTAWNLDHGEPVVKIEGITGGVALSHLELLEETSQK